MATIIEVLWPERSPNTARVAVRNHVARIRQTLGDDSVGTSSNGYQLGIGWSTDLDAFDADIRRARRALLNDDQVVARRFFERAARSVRGDAFADLPDSDEVVAERFRRQHLHLGVEDELLLVLIAADQLAVAIAEGSAMVAREPFRESRWMALALALYRSGQRRESVLCLQRGRDGIREIAGLEAGPALRRMELQILNDDPLLSTAHPADLITRIEPNGLLDVGRAGVFVGRSAILADVRRRSARAFDDRVASATTIVGSAGVGKSALGQRIGIEAAIDGWQVVAVQCSVRPTHVLEPFGDIIRQVIDGGQRRAEVFDPQLLDDVALLWAGDADTVVVGDIVEAVLELIAEHVRHTPTLILVDDADNISATARMVLDRVRRSGGAVAVIELRRRPPTGTTPIVDDTDHVIELRPLDITESTRLLELITGTVVAPADAAAVHSATQGDPQLVLQAAADLLPGPRRESNGRPERYVRASFDRMPAATQRIADVLAIAGQALSSAILAAVDGEPVAEIRLAASEGIAGGVMLQDEQAWIDLTSNALREAIVEAMSIEARVEVHHRLGLAFLEHAQNSLAAAPHLIDAATIDPGLAVHVAQRAADVASRAMMFTEAAEFLASATRIAIGLHGANHRRTAMLQLAWAENLRRSGDPASDELIWDVVERAERTGDHDTFARAVTALCKLGPRSEAGYLNADVSDAVERTFEVCTDQELLARLGSQATLFYSMSGEPGGAREHFDRALRSARASGDVRVIVEVMGNVVTSLVHPTDWPLAADLADEMLPLAERLGDDEQIFEALYLYFGSQVQFASPLLRTTFARQLEMAVRRPTAPRRWMTGYLRACIAFLDGELDEAMEISESNVGTSTVALSRQMSTHWVQMLGVRLAQGRAHEMAEEIDEVIRQQPTLPGWRAVAAWIAALDGNTERVITECDALDCGRSLPPDLSWSGAAMLLGRAIARIGDTERAAIVAEVLAPYAPLMTWIGSTTVGPFGLALAELAITTGELATAEAHLQHAQRAVDRLRAVVFQPDIDDIRRRIAAAVTDG